MILIDFSGLIYAATFIKKEHKENFDLVRHMVLYSILRFKKKFESDYGEIIICCDGTNNWRKEFFPNYKAVRKIAREQDDFDWFSFYKNANELLDDFRNDFPFKVIQIDRAEADDVIAILATDTNEKTVIVSNDKDFTQCLKNPNIKVYQPSKNKFLENENPKKFLLEHIICGDVSDGIPNIFSDDDVFLQKNKRQKPVRKVFIETFMKNKEFAESLPEQVKKNILRNSKLIDFEKIPQDIKIEIRKQFEETTCQNFNAMKLQEYMLKKSLNNLYGKIGEFKNERKTAISSI